ncbi:MAG TPA: FliA/WhiG family RNA polymerase sigma factor [Candidatus Hydrogenedentes bacterium]|nr:FliA/WhiG family RNA polymerase sigma factor [Candidatus Hydrogenedentota bacterium]
MKEHDEKELWIRYKEYGDEGAREALILGHMRTVKYIAGRMAIHVPPSVEINDLIGWGIMGLMDAIEKYDHKQDVKFATYASIRIRGAIIDQIRSLDWAPRSLRSMARRIGAAREKVRHEKGAEATISEIAETLGASEEQIDDAIQHLQTAQILSLDDYLPSEDDGQEGRKQSIVINASAPHPGRLAEQSERVERLVQAILQLPDQQQKVLNLYYYEELTLKEIGAVLDVSESRVCQIHGAAMKRLRKVMQEEH